MRAGDVTETLDMALAASGCDSAQVVHKPRLLSDNGASYVAGDLADWLAAKGMTHVRGAPNHPQTQAKIERWHQTPKNRVLTPADVYLGRGKAILAERERVKKLTIRNRRLSHGGRPHNLNPIEPGPSDARSAQTFRKL